MKILIVEDAFMILMELESFVAGLGHEVTTAPSGYVALDTLVKHHQKGVGFDAIITDMQMPNGTGLELLQALDRLPWRPPCLLHSMVGTYPIRTGDATCEFELRDIDTIFPQTRFHLKPISMRDCDLQYIKQFLEEVATRDQRPRRRRA